MIASSFVIAFRRNCPGVRMTEDEASELIRLFREAQRDAAAEARAALAAELAREASR
jgi:hypothetical protein